jgi:hypothetical protein
MVAPALTAAQRTLGEEPAARIFAAPTPEGGRGAMQIKFRLAVLKGEGGEDCRKVPRVWSAGLTCGAGTRRTAPGRRGALPRLALIQGRVGALGCRGDSELALGKDSELALGRDSRWRCIDGGWATGPG